LMEPIVLTVGNPRLRQLRLGPHGEEPIGGRARSRQASLRIRVPGAKAVGTAGEVVSPEVDRGPSQVREALKLLSRERWNLVFSLSLSGG
jgi:hypothetical protein